MSEPTVTKSSRPPPGPRQTRMHRPFVTPGDRDSKARHERRPYIESALPVHPGVEIAKRKLHNALADLCAFMVEQLTNAGRDDASIVDLEIETAMCRGHAAVEGFTADLCERGALLEHMTLFDRRLAAICESARRYVQRGIDAAAATTTETTWKSASGGSAIISAGNTPRGGS